MPNVKQRYIVYFCPFLRAYKNVFFLVIKNILYLHIGNFNI